MGGPDRSSMGELHAGPGELMGLLASGLKMARRSGERGPLLSWRAIAGAIIGDIGCGARVGWASWRGDGTAAWRRREGVRLRWGKLGEGSVGLSPQVGLRMERSRRGASWVVSIWSCTGCLDRSEPKPPFFAAYGVCGWGEAGGVYSVAAAR